MTCHLQPGKIRPTATSAVVCGPCWAAHGGQPDAGEIGAEPRFTVPSHDPNGQAHWLRCLQRQDWVTSRRADGRRNLLVVARTLAFYADWDSLDSRPTWARLTERTRLGESTVARWLQELRVRGWVAHLERGSTPEFRPLALAHIEGHRAAVYGLRIPVTPEEAVQLAADQLADETAAQLQAISEGPSTAGLGPLHITAELFSKPAAGDTDQEAAEGVDELVDQAAGDVSGVITGSPPWFSNPPKEGLVGGFSRARLHAVDKSTTSAPVVARHQTDALRARFEKGPWLDWAVTVPTTRAQMLAAAAWLQRSSPVFAQLTVRAIRRELRPYWAAQWTGQDVVHALRHRPGVFGQVSGVPLYTTPHVDSPLLLIRGRLRAWCGPDGQVLPGRCSSAAAVQAKRGRIGVRLLRAGGGVLTVEQVIERGRRAAAELAREAAEVASWRPVRPASPQPSRPERSSGSRRTDRHRAELQAAAERGEQLRARRAAEHQAMLDRYAEQLHAARADLAANTRPDSLPAPVDQEASSEQRYELARQRAREARRRRR